VQVTLYYSNDDHYIIDLVDKLALRDRKSRSAVVISILEEYFERGKALGEILIDMGALDARDLEAALKTQQGEKRRRELGQILVEQGLVDEHDLARAVTVFERHHTKDKRGAEHQV